MNTDTGHFICHHFFNPPNNQTRYRFVSAVYKVFLICPENYFTSGLQTQLRVGFFPTSRGRTRDSGKPYTKGWNRQGPLSLPQS